MSEHISVERIEIKIGKKSLTLTPEEMRELRDILDRTFPKPEKVYVPGQPIIIERPTYYPWKYWREPTWTMTSNKHATVSLSLAKIP